MPVAWFFSPKLPDSTQEFPAHIRDATPPMPHKTLACMN
jgi:hypothetical protein